METILITWTSWFIWFHTARRLLEEWNTNIIWFDSENDYYDVNLKIARRSILEKFENFKFYKWNLANNDDLSKIFEKNNIDKICHLAAQAWVRYSIENPFAYIQSNIVWFANIIEWVTTTIATFCSLLMLDNNSPICKWIILPSISDLALKVTS